MAPHYGAPLGFRRALPQMVIAALLGDLLMVFADWCGRMLLFPVSDPRRVIGDLYRCAVLRLSVA